MPDDRAGKNQDSFLQRQGLILTCHAEPGSEAESILRKAKVLGYAAAMPVDFSALRDPRVFVAELHADITAQTAPAIATAPDTVFHGKTARELNALLDSLPSDPAVREVRVTAAEMLVDEPIRIRSRTWLRGERTICWAGEADIALLGQDVENFAVSGFTIKSARVCAIMLKSCRHGRLGHISAIDSQDYGIVVRGHSSYLRIDTCRFENSRRAGLMIEDGSNHVLVHRCEATGGRHSSNWAAGIVLTALRPVTEFGIRDAFEPSYFYPNDLSFKAETVPHHNLIEDCVIHKNQSSGIYIDGGNGNVLMGNTITENDKEGLCLDFYAAANLAVGNVIRNNGFRRHQTDDDLRSDMVLACGRLEDGSAAAKVPNVSLDNAACNILLENVISGGAGGGIKVVRSGFRNVFGINTLVDNNAGGNRVFTFPGILLGSAGAEMEGDTSGLDRTGSFENVLVKNVICGNHSVGIMLDPKSTFNDIRRNLVTGQIGPPMVMLTAPNHMAENSFDMPARSTFRSRLWNYCRVIKAIFAR